MKDSRKLYKLLLIIPIFIIFSCTSPGVEEQIYKGEALGTTYQFKFFHNDHLDLNQGIDSVFAVINQSMSTYIPTSDISRINGGDTSVTVDHNFQEVFKLSYKIYTESGGYFDPTVGKLVNAYGFGPETSVSIHQKVIDSLLPYVGLDKIRVTPEGLVEKESPGIYLDFNAIAKGYAVDAIARYFDQQGIEDYLLEIGGEMVGKGVNKGKDKSWVVGIDNPLQSQNMRTLQAAVRLEDRAMATSGNYRKFKTDPETGRAYVHSINPLTGMAEKSNILSASVLAENCALADGYATAFMVMGLEESMELLKKLDNVDVFFIYAGEENALETYASPGFDKVLVPE